LDEENKLLVREVSKSWGGKVRRKGWGERLREKVGRKGEEERLRAKVESKGEEER